MSDLRWQVLEGDARVRLRDLPDASIQTCITSPPYWALRDYGIDGQIGLESTLGNYVDVLVDVFREVWRVLRNDGTVWLNLGDMTVRGAGGKIRDAGGNIPDGLKSKDLCGIPWRVAFALQADDWYLRSDIIWSKPNPMPEGVMDRPTKAHEYIFLLSKAARYYYDAEAVKESAIYGRREWSGNNFRSIGSAGNAPEHFQSSNGGGDGSLRNKRSVWHIPTQACADAHFATFPEALVEPCILAGSKVADTVLDPFVGSGTTGAVAIRHQRNFVGIELNPEYIQLAKARIGSIAPLFAMEDTAPIDTSEPMFDW
jgi:DNA modification methylase